MSRDSYYRGPASHRPIGRPIAAPKRAKPKIARPKAPVIQRPAVPQSHASRAIDALHRQRELGAVPGSQLAKRLGLSCTELLQQIAAGRVPQPWFTSGQTQFWKAKDADDLAIIFKR